MASNKLKMNKILTILVLVASCFSLAHLVSCKMVRLSLGKSSSMKAGDLGQPLTSYYANVDVGTPPKAYKLLLDVNARETWLPHFLKLGLIYQRLNYMNGYAKKDSTTSIKEDQEYTIEYEQNQLTGKAYRDYFEFKNVSGTTDRVRFLQRFLAISSASNDRFTRYAGVDGVMALYQYTISETGSESVVIGMNRAEFASELKFSLLLDANTDTDQGGELVFGDTDRASFIGRLKYHPVSGPNWGLKLQSVMLGSSVVSCSQANCDAIVSTSKNDIYGPPGDVKQILKLLHIIKTEAEFKEDHLYEIDCLQVASTPPLTFIIEGAYYTIHPLSFIKKKVDGLIFKSTTCYLSILSNGSQKTWELGTNFVANFYTVFDVNQRQVAFGMRK